MEIQRDTKNGKLWLSQKTYISHVLEKFNMSSAKPVSTSLTSHFAWSAKQCPFSLDDCAKMSTTSYASAIGCLMYAMVYTGTDIAHAVGMVTVQIWVKSTGKL